MGDIHFIGADKMALLHVTIEVADRVPSITVHFCGVFARESRGQNKIDATAKTVKNIDILTGIFFCASISIGFLKEFSKSFYFIRTMRFVRVLPPASSA